MRRLPKIHLNGCARCHGADNPSEADADLGATILHGQRKDYLRYALGQYATGERQQLPAMEKVTVTEINSRVPTHRQARTETAV